MQTLNGELYECRVRYKKTITFIFNWSKGWINAIANVFFGLSHDYCLHHLEANLHKALAFSQLKPIKDNCMSLSKRIAFMLTWREYEDGLWKSREVPKPACKQLHENAVQEHLCNYLFHGNKYGEVYPTVVESFNAWMKEARTLPMTNMTNMIK